MIDGDIHYPVTELLPEDRRDGEKVDEADKAKILNGLRSSLAAVQSKFPQFPVPELTRRSGIQREVHCRFMQKR
jgi:hypothetical protein